MKQDNTIIGEDIFFNFLAFNQEDIQAEQDLLKKVVDGDIDGFVSKGVFSQQEVDAILSALQEVPESDMMSVPTGHVYPLPFATISDDEKLGKYVNASKALQAWRKDPAIHILLNKLDTFLKKVGSSLNVDVPKTADKQNLCAPGNFRIFQENKGGLFVHCGYLFQEQAPYYYKVVEPMALDGQLSYFLVLQNSNEGGELTIYDMLWNQIKRKDSDEENEYVLDEKGDKLYLKDVKSFQVSPKAGDILIFRGGPIWHRVENIKGPKPRITFGGFLNLTPDQKGIRYWS